MQRLGRSEAVRRPGRPASFEPKKFTKFFGKSLGNFGLQVGCGAFMRIPAIATVPEKRFVAFVPFRSGPSSWAAGEFRTKNNLAKFCGKLLGNCGLQVGCGAFMRIPAIATVPEKRFAGYGPFRSRPSTWAAGEFRTKKKFGKLLGNFGL